MKPNIRIFSLLLASANFVHSQNEVSAVSLEAAKTPAPRTTARILGGVPDGTPPPPAPPKPEYKVAERDLLSTTIHEQGEHKITIREIRPIALPSPSAPESARLRFGASEEFQQRLAEYREAHPRFRTMFMGATVYRSKDQPPCTLIHIWPDGGGKPIQLWSSIDMALIAGGIKTFSDSAGNTHHLMIAWSNLYIDRLSDHFASKGRELPALPMPKFPKGKATFQILGNQPDAEDLVAIQSLHDLYHSEHDRLQIAYEGREKSRIQQEAYLEAHPPQSEDITLSYWRTEKPATEGKGGSR